jgi:hypothetical protein
LQLFFIQLVLGKYLCTMYTDEQLLTKEQLEKEIHHLGICKSLIFFAGIYIFFEAFLSAYINEAKQLVSISKIAFGCLFIILYYVGEITLIARFKTAIILIFAVVSIFFVFQFLGEDVSLLNAFTSPDDSVKISTELATQQKESTKLIVKILLISIRLLLSAFFIFKYFDGISCVKDIEKLEARTAAFE